MRYERADPVALAEYLWPWMTLYDKQKEILLSVDDNDETVVPSGHELGKTFVDGVAAWIFYLRHEPCRVITTSVSDAQLEHVLWGNIHNLYATCAYDLPVTVGSKHVYKLGPDGNVLPLSYMIGLVASSDTKRQGQALSGHHLAMGAFGEPRTLGIIDEAAGVPHASYDKLRMCTHRRLITGNPYPCDNFFRFAVEGDPANENDRGGDVVHPDSSGRLVRKIIHLCANDSPNVRYAVAQKKLGIPITYEELVPGVISYDKYLAYRSTMNPMEQCIKLDGKWYKGADIMLYPPEWLQASHDWADELETRGSFRRVAKAIGVDPAEGGDKSSWSVVDEYGLMFQVSLKTPDTTDVVSRTIAIMKRFSVPAENVVFDRGGGGKEHADRMRSLGHDVRTVGFGERPQDPRKYNSGIKTRLHKMNRDEIAYAYTNRRAEMYWLLRDLMEPKISRSGRVRVSGFAIPRRYSDCIRQLSVMPALFDAEGRMAMLPKRKKPGVLTSNVKTLIDILGRSPDEADSLVLACYGMCRKAIKMEAGVPS